MMPRNFFHRSSGGQPRPRSWHRQILAALCSLLLLASGAAHAQGAPNPLLRQAVDRFMTNYVDKLKSRLGPKTRIEYRVGALDYRLNVGTCAKPLAIETKDNVTTSSRINLQISCQQAADSWSIYLPVDLSMHRSVVVSVKPLAHGSTIGADDVRLAEYDVSQINGQYLSELEEVVGKDVKRPIAAGAPILSQQLLPPLMVRRGEAVTINAASKIVAVRSAGIALTDGRLGEQIRIKNQSSTRIVNARITGPGQAEVPM